MAYHKKEEKSATGTGVLNVAIVVTFLGVAGLFCAAAPEVIGAILLIVIPILITIFVVEKCLAALFKALGWKENS